MDYEQKYKEALRRAETIIKVLESNHIKNFIYNIFPELMESEDDRMKREILELVSISGNGNQFEEIKDWLEKQKEKLDAKKVIGWIDEHIPTKFEDVANYVENFKQDFGLFQQIN